MHHFINLLSHLNNINNVKIHKYHLANACTGVMAV